MTGECPYCHHGLGALAFAVPLVLSWGPEGAFWDWGSWSRRAQVGRS